MMRIICHVSAYAVLSLGIVMSAHAADVIKIKGKSALIDLKGEPASAGDTFFAMSGSKKRAIISIRRVKGDKAIGIVTKGKAEAGMTLEPKGERVAARSTRHEAPAPRGRPQWGVLGGYAQDSAKVKVKWQRTAGTHTAGDVKETAALSDSGFSLSGFFDYPWLPQLWVRGLAGVENFSVKGASSCGVGNNEACNAKIMYLSGGGIVRWLFLTGDFRPWVGGGLNLMFPMSKSGNALDTSSIGTAYVLLASTGFDWQLSPNFFIPVSVEYGMLPRSTEVDAHWIQFRFGLGIPF